MRITVTINKNDVTDEIAQTTGYAGWKKLGTDPAAYERISTTEYDTPMLCRYWQESIDEISGALRRLTEAEGMEGQDYRIDLNLSQAFDQSLASSIQTGLFNFMVNAMTARWLKLVGDEKATEYASAASALLADITRKAYCKKAPIRPSYTN